MFRENTLDYIKDLRAWSINMASRTVERQDFTRVGDVSQLVITLADAYLKYVTNYTVSDALVVNDTRRQFVGSLRDKAEVDAALASELEYAREALKKAKESATQEEADEFLKSAEFSFMQCASTKAELIAGCEAADPRILAKEVAND
jgi:hypothetical protein